MRTKLVILGCGSSVGVPRIDSFWGNCSKKNKKNVRTRCSISIVKGSNSILIDTSPDLRNQLISNKIKNLSSVIYTHEHADQTNGIFELRPFFWKNKKKIDVYGNLKTLNILKKRFDFCFKTINGYPACIKANVIGKKFSLGKSNERIYFQTIQVRHGSVKNTAYIFENTAYINDCNDLSIIKMRQLKNLKYLIIDCLKMDKHPTHFNLEECLYVHNHLKPRNTILTNLHYDLDYNFLKQRLPNRVIPAYDGLKLYL